MEMWLTPWGKLGNTHTRYQREKGKNEGHLNSEPQNKHLQDGIQN
jgi:hypothetical protein